MTTTTVIDEYIEVFDKLFLARKRKSLVRELVEQERALAALKAQLAGSEEGLDGNSGRNDDSERSRRIASRGETESLERQVSAYLLELEAAIARIGSGAYGRCEGCGRMIGVDRLEALPEVSLCAACKSTPVSMLNSRV